MRASATRTHKIQKQTKMVYRLRITPKSSGYIHHIIFDVFSVFIRSYSKSRDTYVLGEELETASALRGERQVAHACCFPSAVFADWLIFPPPRFDFSTPAVWFFNLRGLIFQPWGFHFSTPVPPAMHVGYWPPLTMQRTHTVGTTPTGRINV